MHGNGALCSALLSKSDCSVYTPHVSETLNAIVFKWTWVDRPGRATTSLKSSFFSLDFSIVGSVKRTRTYNGIILVIPREINDNINEREIAEKNVCIICPLYGLLSVSPLLNIEMIQLGEQGLSIIASMPHLVVLK